MHNRSAKDPFVSMQRMLHTNSSMPRRFEANDRHPFPRLPAATLEALLRGLLAARIEFSLVEVDPGFRDCIVKMLAWLRCIWTFTPAVLGDLLGDTAVSRLSSKDSVALQRSTQNSYDESLLIWPEVDTLVRQQIPRTAGDRE